MAKQNQIEEHVQTEEPVKTKQQMEMEAHVKSLTDIRDYVKKTYGSLREKYNTVDCKVFVAEINLGIGKVISNAEDLLEFLNIHITQLDKDNKQKKVKIDKCEKEFLSQFITKRIRLDNLYAKYKARKDKLIKL
jgi:hypothetical protein